MILVYHKNTYSADKCSDYAGIFFIFIKWQCLQHAASINTALPADIIMSSLSTINKTPFNSICHIAYENYMYLKDNSH